MNADPLDQAAEMELFLEEARIKSIRAKAQLLPGVSGECDHCGEHSLRLINGACAPCRDRKKLP